MSNVFVLPPGVQSSTLPMFHINSELLLFAPPRRAISIMREARSKLRLIKPEDMDMEEYLVLSKSWIPPSSSVASTSFSQDEVSCS